MTTESPWVSEGLHVLGTKIPRDSASVSVLLLSKAVSTLSCDATSVRRCGASSIRARDKAKQEASLKLNTVGLSASDPACFTTTSRNPRISSSGEGYLKLLSAQREYSPMPNRRQ